MTEEEDDAEWGCDEGKHGAAMSGLSARVKTVSARLAALVPARLEPDAPPRALLRRDLMVAAAALGIGLVLFAFPMTRSTYGGLSLLWLLPPMVVVSGSLAFRRIAPWVTLIVGTVGLIANYVVGQSLSTILIYTEVLSSAAMYGPKYLSRWLLRITVAFCVIVAVVTPVITRDVQTMLFGLFIAAVLVMPVMTANTIRLHREQAEAERRHAAQVARMAELDRRHAVDAERARMARELHDVIANHLSAIALQSAGALSMKNPHAMEEVLQVIRESSLRGLAEMRRMIALLRDEEQPDPLTAPPRLDEIGRLMENARHAGLDVELQQEGDAVPLPAAVDLAAYRIVQESLTNALKHGGGGRVQVTIGYRPTHLTITVTNPLADGDTAAGEWGAGAGLHGMAERVSLLGGHFRAGPQVDQWVVTAELPLGGEAA